MILLLISLTLQQASDPFGKNISGQNQCVLSGKCVNIAVQATEKGKPVANQWIKFIPHNGKVSSDSVKTNNTGFASVEFIPEKDGWVEAKAKDQTVEIHPSVFPKQSLIRFILSVIIGTVLILMGLDNLNKGFSRFSGEKIRQMLWRMTKHPLLAYLSGILVAVLLESSTLTGLMLLSLLESSLIKLSTSLIILSGAALGSTFTVQIIATDIIQFSPIIVLIGFILWQTKSRLSYIGRVALGFGLIFFSIWLIRDNIQPLKDIFALNINPFLLFLSSVILTFLFHSSAATLGLAIAFAGALNFASIIPIILGVNIGTSFTVLLGSTRFSSSSGKAMGIGYVIIKTIFVTLSLYLFFIPTGAELTARAIANLHTLVNCWGFLLIPFCFPLAKYLKNLYGKEKSKIIYTKFIYDTSLFLFTSFINRIYVKYIKNINIIGLFFISSLAIMIISAFGLILNKHYFLLGLCMFILFLVYDGLKVS